MTNTAMTLPAPVGGSTADLESKVRFIGVYLFNDRAVVRATTDAALAHVQAMHELAALSFDSNSLDRESAVDIWGFHGSE